MLHSFLEYLLLLYSGSSLGISLSVALYAQAVLNFSELPEQARCFCASCLCSVSYPRRTCLIWRQSSCLWMLPGGYAIPNLDSPPLCSPGCPCLSMYHTAKMLYIHPFSLAGLADSWEKALDFSFQSLVLCSNIANKNWLKNLD